MKTDGLVDVNEVFEPKFVRNDDMIPVRYRCTGKKCNNEQIIRFGPMERRLPVTCCVKCRAGFGIELTTMLANMIGMFPVAE